MDLQNEKCVMVIDEQLPLGIIANTAAITGITLGKAMPEVVGASATRTGTRTSASSSSRFRFCADRREHQGAA